MELVNSEKNARSAQLLDLGRQVDHQKAEISDMVRSQVRLLLQNVKVIEIDLQNLTEHKGRKYIYISVNTNMNM